MYIPPLGGKILIAFRSSCLANSGFICYRPPQMEKVHTRFPVSGIKSVDKELWALFQPASDEREFTYDRPAATSLLTRMLADPLLSPHVLSLLGLTCTVLSTNSMHTELIEFLFDSSQILADSPEHGFDMSTPFLYVLAFSLGDDAMLARYGSILNMAAVRLRELHGPAHPSVIACEIYRAWHQIRLRSSSASDIEVKLRSCILRAEASLGLNSLLGINGLAVLGRLLREQGDYEAAMSICNEAVARLGPDAGHLRAYQLEILQGMAEIEGSRGNTEKAEILMRLIYTGRQYVFGPEHVYTLEALARLEHFTRRDME